MKTRENEETNLYVNFVTIKSNEKQFFIKIIYT